MKHTCNIYEKLLEECNPDRAFEHIYEEVEALEDEDSEETVKSWTDCTTSFLKRYMKFASGCMSDGELYRFYNDVLKMLDEGIEARERQKRQVDDEVDEAWDLYHNEIIDESEIEEIEESAKAIKEEIDRDIELLKEVKSFCLKAKNRLDVVTCIEKVANMSHSRGSMLPVLCGAYLPEFLVEGTTRLEREYVIPADFGLELSKIVPRVFECIKNFGRKD